jgi:trehalose-phosphatase
MESASNAADTAVEISPERLLTPPPIPIDGAPEFWDRVFAAESVALFLDYDGTLAPFHADRMLAVPMHGVVDALLKIIDASDTRLAIVSGRPTAEILHLAGDLELTIVGSHGWESHRPVRGRQYVPVSTSQEGVLDAAYDFAAGLLGAERVERKVASVAAHLRGLPPQEYTKIEQQLATNWLANAGEGIVEFRPFNGGVELRALGRHKGSAILELLAEMPARTLPVFLGDDDTDEDAFQAIRDIGYGIRVGPHDRPTAARGQLASCELVPRFLVDWTRVRAAGAVWRQR